MTVHVNNYLTLQYRDNVGIVSNTGNGNLSNLFYLDNNGMTSPDRYQIINLATNIRDDFNQQFIDGDIDKFLNALSIYRIIFMARNNLNQNNPTNNRGPEIFATHRFYKALQIWMEYVYSDFFADNRETYEHLFSFDFNFMETIFRDDLNFEIVDGIFYNYTYSTGMSFYNLLRTVATWPDHKYQEFLVRLFFDGMFDYHSRVLPSYQCSSAAYRALITTREDQWLIYNDLSLNNVRRASIMDFTRHSIRETCSHNTENAICNIHDVRIINDPTFLLGLPQAQIGNKKFQEIITSLGLHIPLNTDYYIHALQQFYANTIPTTSSIDSCPCYQCTVNNEDTMYPTLSQWDNFVYDDHGNRVGQHVSSSDTEGLRTNRDGTINSPWTLSDLIANIPTPPLPPFPTVTSNSPYYYHYIDHGNLPRNGNNDRIEFVPLAGLYQSNGTSRPTQPLLRPPQIEIPRANREGDLGSYNWTPRIWHKKSNQQTDILYGIELEINVLDKPEFIINDMFEISDNVFAKYDGSLDNDGIELVFHPMSLDYWRDINYNPISTLGMIPHAGYGMHVHVSRDTLMHDEQLKIIQYFNNPGNTKIIRKVAARNSPRWASTYPSYATNPERGYTSTNKYNAVNTCHPDTLEIRIFKASVNKNTILMRLEFLESLITWIRSNDYVVDDAGIPLASDHLEWVRDNPITYPRFARTSVRILDHLAHLVA